jgi:hypothetical protein
LIYSEVCGCFQGVGVLLVISLNFDGYVFELTPLDPTSKFHAHITKTLKQCNLIFHKIQQAHLILKNPTPPKLKAQLKIHKPGIPIRPVVINRTVPTYKAAKKN